METHCGVWPLCGQPGGRSGPQCGRSVRFGLRRVYVLGLRGGGSDPAGPDPIQTTMHRRDQLNRLPHHTQERQVQGILEAGGQVALVAGHHELPAEDSVVKRSGHQRRPAQLRLDEGELTPGQPSGDRGERGDTQDRQQAERYRTESEE